MKMTACDIYQKALQGDIKNYDQRISRRVTNIMRRLGCDEPVHTTLNGIQGKYFDLSGLVQDDLHTGNVGWIDEK
jgi:hypothetical protein